MLYQDAFLHTLEAGLRTLLPRWGLAEAAPLTLLNISENATYLAHDAAGDRRIVLRVHRPGYHTQAEILSELDWIDALRHSGSVETPCPLRPLDGSAFCSFADYAGRYQVAAFSHMSGVQPQGRRPAKVVRPAWRRQRQAAQPVPRLGAAAGLRA